MASTFQASSFDCTTRMMAISERIRAAVSQRATIPNRSNPWKYQAGLAATASAHNMAGQSRSWLRWTAGTIMATGTTRTMERKASITLAPSTPARRSLRRSGSWRWRATSRVAE